MNCAIVTGAAGFTGTVLVERLLKTGFEVVAVVRRGSEHNKRVAEKAILVECNLDELTDLPEMVTDVMDLSGGVFFHLAWTGGKDKDSQCRNVQYTLDALRGASELGCYRFICTGSQAEYGTVPSDELILEDHELFPFSEYGMAKVEACRKSRILAKELGIEWIWGRIFSLIGRYEPAGRMLPDLYRAMKNGSKMKLSSCRQNWDYLDVYDAADALIALAERGVDGEIYNIANGGYRPLRKYVEELCDIVKSFFGKCGVVEYGVDPSPFVSLQPSIYKIKKDTGWSPTREFKDSVNGYEES